MKQLTAAQVTKKFAEAGVYADKLFKSKGQFVAREGFFYRHGRTAVKWAAKVATVPGVKVVSSREVWQPWPKDSYFEAVFTFEQEA